MYLIKTASKISGVSVRTLHYYDEIGLLSPEKRDNGYRYYSEKDMSVLQMILFYKYLGFSLKKIKKMLKEEDKDVLGHLKKQFTLLEDERRRLLTLMDTLEKTIISYERRTEMRTQEKFKGFKYEDSQKHVNKAINKYGKTVVERAIEKQRGREEEVTEGFNRIFFGFAENKENGLLANNMENIKLAETLHKHICEYAFDCSLEAFSGIGKGYAANKDFKDNLDKFGEGVAEYISQAISEYVRDI